MQHNTLNRDETETGTQIPNFLQITEVRLVKSRLLDNFASELELKD